MKKDCALNINILNLVQVVLTWARALFAELRSFFKVRQKERQKTLGAQCSSKEWPYFNFMASHISLSTLQKFTDSLLFLHDSALFVIQITLHTARLLCTVHIYIPDALSISKSFQKCFYFSCADT